MERGIQIKLWRGICIGLLCLCSGMICGCSVTGADTFLTDHNRYPVDIFNNQLERELYCLYSDTQDICIIEDEFQYDNTYIQSPAGILFNIDSNEVLYSKNGREPYPIASLTKLMTALLVLESNTLEDTVTVGEEVNITEYDAWLCYFHPGDMLTMRDLMYATLIYSGNDAAAALAAHVGGTVENFVDFMNAKAEELGAKDTSFANPHGLDAEGHYSSLYDLYLIFNQCIQYREFRNIIDTQSYVCSYTHADGTEESRKFSNTNWYYTGEAKPPDGITILGGKTGNTAKAHRCLMILAENEAGERFLAGILGAEDQVTLYREMNRLLKLAE